MQLCTTFVSVLLFASVVSQNTEAPSPPATPKHPVVDEYHGVKVTDDYRWLEDGKSPDVVAWTAAQDKYARSHLDPLPLHTSIYEFMKRLDSERSSSYYDLQSRSGVLFAMTSQPSKQQDMLVTISSADDPGSRHLVLDPTALDPANSTTIQAFVPSLDGSKVALSLPSGGAMVSNIYIYDVATGRALPDVLTHVSGLTGSSVAWSADGTGLYYTHYPHEGERSDEDLNFYEQVYFHKLGTPQSTDTYELGKDFPRIVDIWLSESKGGKYVLAEVGNGDMGRFQLFLRGPSGGWTQIAKFSDEVHAAIFGDDALYMVSHQNAPHGKLLRLPLASPAFENAQTIVPEGEAVIQDFQYTFGGPRPTFVATPNLLYVTELVGGPSRIRVYDHNGKDLGTVPSEPVSAITQIVPLENDRILFRNESYLDSPAWFYYDPGSRKSTVTALRESRRVGFADAKAVRALCSSKDGTKVPLTIIQRKGTKLDGQNPAILTGYGGFGLSLTPMFDPEIRAWLDAGGVYVVANLRGGGEFGEEWHKNGSGLHKQNVFDDFIACAEYLIQAGYTKPAKLGIEGGSNGGLLMAAVATERPELFGAVVSVAGLYDMLRAETTENGQLLTAEFGSVKEPVEFRVLYAYSPYHHVQDGTKYPPILFLTGENDPAVDPANSRKMTARLQTVNASGRPVLLVNFTNAGHGGIGASEEQQAAIDSYLYEFMFDQLRVKWPSSGQGSR